VKRHLAPILWIAAGLLFCAFLVTTRSPGSSDLTRHLLFFGACLALDAGCAARTLVNRAENTSGVNFGFKLMAAGIFALLILIGFVRAVWL